MAQCRAKNVDFRFNTWSERSDIINLSPDVVIIATGGMPHTEILKTGNDLVVSAWDIIAGDVAPARNVLIYDGAGDHAALQAAETIAQTGAKVEVMTFDRSFSPEIMGANLVPYMRALQQHDVTFTVTYRLLDVKRDGNQLRAIIGTDYSELRHEKCYDQIVVNHGTRPLDDLYFDLKPLSLNLGEMDYDALLSGQPQRIIGNSAGKFQLFRIGDAVSARNTHAAIYDALRLLKDI